MIRAVANINTTGLNTTVLIIILSQRLLKRSILYTFCAAYPYLIEHSAAGKYPHINCLVDNDMLVFSFCATRIDLFSGNTSLHQYTCTICIHTIIEAKISCRLSALDTPLCPWTSKNSIALGYRENTAISNRCEDFRSWFEQ